MDLSYQSKSMPEQGDSPKFFVDSTISKDRTEGRKQNEEEVLKNLPQQPVDIALLADYIDNPPLDSHQRAMKISPSLRSQSQPTGNGSTQPEYKSQVAEPSAFQTSFSPILWREDLKLRRSAMFQPHKDCDNSLKNEHSVSESVAFKKSSKVKDEATSDSQYEMIQVKVRPSLFTN
jgi:hypothetical protein